MNLAKSIIEHSSPTLAGIKTANLFTVKYKNLSCLYLHIDEMNTKFSDKGVTIQILKIKGNTALIYVYRENMLICDMKDESSREILDSYGYKGLDVLSSIERLSKRLNDLDEFPHEIGLFLGYPPQDVLGFICHKGKNCNLCGYWKVYGDTSEALKKFAKYDKCKAVYKKLWQEGRDILKLTVKKQLVA